MKWEMATSDLTNQSKKLVSEGYFLCIIIVLELIVVSTSAGIARVAVRGPSVSHLNRLRSYSLLLHEQ